MAYGIYTIRDKEGKLVSTFQSDGQGIPQNIMEKFGIGAGGGLKPGYTANFSMQPDAGSYYLNPNDRYHPYEAGKLASDSAAFQANIKNLSQETATRRSEELKRAETANANLQRSIGVANQNRKLQAQTTNNPFITNRMVTQLFAKKANAAITDAITAAKDRDESIDSFNALTFQDEYTKNAEYLAAKRADSAGRGSVQSREHTGLVVTEKPRGLTKEQSLEWNKQSAAAQIALLYPSDKDKNKLVSLKAEQRPLPSFSGDELFPTNTSETGFPKVINPNKVLPTQYVITDKKGNVQRHTNLTQDEINAYQRIGNTVQIESSVTKYKVTDPSGKERTFNTKETADKFADKYGTKPVQTAGVAGSLDYLFGQKPKVQGANLSDSAFFVGANAEGYLIDTKRKIEPRPTFTDFFGNNEYTMRLDKIYETNKPLSERSDQTRVGVFGFSNRELGELAAPFVNRAVEARDTIVASATGGKFAWEPGFLGIPSYQPVRKSPKIETTLDRLASGKPVDFSDKNARFSAYGSTLAFAGELYAFGKGVGAGNKAIEGIEKGIQTSKVAKATKLTNEGQVSGFTKIGDDTFVIARGTEGKSITVNPKIESTLIGIDKTGKPISSKVPVPEPPTGRFSWGKFSRTKNESDPFTPTTQPPPNVPVSVVEFGVTAKFKGGSITDFFKTGTLTKEKPGTPYIVEGEVNSSILKDFGLKEIRGPGSKEFGIETSGKTLYQGILNENNISKVLEAERFGFIKPYAVGKTAPLKDVLKGKTSSLREYAGAKTGTTRIGKGETEYDFFYHGTSSQNAKKILKEGLLQDSFLSNEIQLSKIYGSFNKKGGSIIEYKIPKTAKKIDYYKITGYGKGTGKSVQDKARESGYGMISPYVGQKNEFILLRSNIAKPTRIINVSKEGKLTSTIIGEKQSKNIFDLFRKTPKESEQINPISTKFFETSNTGIRTPVSFGLVNTGKIRPGETRGVTGIGSKGLDRMLNQVGLSTAKEASKRKTNLRPFDFGDIAASKGTGGSTGKGASLSLDEGLKAASSYVKSKPVTAQPQDILFSSPRGLLPQYQGVQEQNILAYPQGTPEKFKNQFKIDTGLESVSRVKLASANSGDYFKRYGLDTINISDSKMDDIFKQIPINIQPTKQREGLKAIITPIAITGLGQTPITSTGLGQTPITTTGLETVPVTELITTPITEITEITKTPIPGFGFGKFGIGFAGFGGGGDDRNRRKKGRKKYIVSSIDPLTPGSIITAGLPQQQVSSKKAIYGRLDIQLGKARKRNQPREKQKKDPFRL